MENITLKKVSSIVIDTSQEISFNMANWPVDGSGNPYRKSECYWTGSMVAVKTTAMQVAEYKTKKFKEMNDKIISKLMYVKKLKSLDTVRGTFIDEYKKTHATIAAVDASIALIETDLFEA